MPKSRQVESAFGLAFLDVMACGLGAVTLIFMLVKYHASVSEAEADHGDLDSEIAEMRALQSASERELSDLIAEYRGLKEKTDDQEALMASRVSDQKGKKKKLQKLMTEVQALEKAAAELRQASSEQPAPIVDTPEPTQDHLLGIRVEGKRILILVDSSASMTDSRIIDILKIQISDQAAKRAAPKWKRTLRAVDWLVERVPAGSQYMIVHYAERADFLHGNRWIDSSDESRTKKAVKALADLVPDGATSLYSALEFIVRHRINPTNIYLVTDGLPTLGPMPSLLASRSAGCGLSGSRKRTITGQCRKVLFHKAVNDHAASINATINTILMPLEGDPGAVYSYWKWASSTGGMVTSPASGWP